MKVKFLWIGLASLLLIYAFYSLVFGAIEPIANPSLQMFSNKVIRAFISIAIAAGILYYTQVQK